MVTVVSDPTAVIVVVANVQSVPPEHPPRRPLRVLKRHLRRSSLTRLATWDLAALRFQTVVMAATVVGRAHGVAELPRPRQSAPRASGSRRGCSDRVSVNGVVPGKVMQ